MPFNPGIQKYCCKTWCICWPVDTVALVSQKIYHWQPWWCSFVWMHFKSILPSIMHNVVNYCFDWSRFSMFMEIIISTIIVFYAPQLAMEIRLRLGGRRKLYRAWKQPDKDFRTWSRIARLIETGRCRTQTVLMKWLIETKHRPPVDLSWWLIWPRNLIKTSAPSENGYSDMTSPSADGPSCVPQWAGASPYWPTQKRSRLVICINMACCCRMSQG